MASLTIISWRDIPAQVVVKRGRETAKVQLSPRFQEAVDRAAMRAGKGSWTFAVSRPRLTTTCAGMSRQEMIVRLAMPRHPGPRPAP